MGMVHKAITVKQYVDYLTDPAYLVEAVVEFNDGNAKKGDYGACVRIYKIGDQDRIATHPHIHYDLNGEPPHTISAHFKMGKAKAAQQGWDLRPWDAYALLFQLKSSQLNADTFKAIGYKRVTLAAVKSMIKNNDLPHLKMVLKSDIYALELWEKEAFTLVQNWNAGENVSSQL